MEEKFQPSQVKDTPETGIIMCTTSSCLKGSASIFTGHKASTSGVMRIMTDKADMSGEWQCATSMLV
jgi:hypothetical protein